jgi:hypothetical protein
MNELDKLYKRKFTHIEQLIYRTAIYPVTSCNHPVRMPLAHAMRFHVQRDMKRLLRPQTEHIAYDKERTRPWMT